VALAEAWNGRLTMTGFGIGVVNQLFTGRGFSPRSS
jgi:hypothetical protein